MENDTFYMAEFLGALTFGGILKDTIVVTSAAGTEYRMVELIGKGTFGRVYRMRATSPGDHEPPEFAIKLFADAQAAMSEYEAHLLLKPVDVKVPVVESVPIYPKSKGQLEKSKFAVVGMPMLERRVWDTMPLSPRDAIDIVRVVATAAAALWEREIMLNDIKAHNIMFGADGRVRIIDVGSIIHADGNAFSATFCPPDHVKAIPDASRVRCTERSIVWQLGVFLLNMVETQLDDRPVFSLAAERLSKRRLSCLACGFSEEQTLKQLYKTALAVRRVVLERCEHSIPVVDATYYAMSQGDTTIMRFVDLLSINV